MQAEVTNNILDNFSTSFTSPFTGSIPQWLSENITFPESSPNPGKFKIGICRWLEDVYTAIKNPEIEIVILQGASQTYKTGVTETIIPYWIINDPAKILRVHHTKDAANNFTKTRLMPMMKSCPPVNALLDSSKIKASAELVILPNMDITITGPTDNFQHGFSVQRITIDEAHLINEPGIFEKFLRRTDQYKGKRKLIISTTPGKQEYKLDKLVGDELSLLVDSGRVFRRAWKCPKCQEYQIWKWSNKRTDGTYSGINWGESIKRDGKTDVERTSDNAKLECHHCRHKLDDTPQTRIELELTARYQCIKDNGNKKIVTYQWAAWVAPHNSFKDACLQYLKAKEQADIHIYEPLQEFTQQVCGESWSNKAIKQRSKLTYIDYDSNSDWADEKYRVMTCDFQGDGRRPYMVVAFDAVGNARLINYGVAFSWEEVETISVKYKVVKPNGTNAHFVGVDCGFDWAAVAKETVRHGIDIEFSEGSYKWKERFGWLCLRGESKDSFDWGDGIKRVVSEQKWYDTTPELPPARLYFWSNKSVKNLVASIRDGNNKLKLEINTQDENLQRQLYSEFPDAHGVWKEKTKENHFFDTLCMAYAMGILIGIPFLGESLSVKN